MQAKSVLSKLNEERVFGTNDDHDDDNVVTMRASETKKEPFFVVIMRKLKGVSQLIKSRYSNHVSLLGRRRMKFPMDDGTRMAIGGSQGIRFRVLYGMSDHFDL